MVVVVVAVEIGVDLLAVVSVASVLVDDGDVVVFSVVVVAGVVVAVPSSHAVDADGLVVAVVFAVSPSLFPLAAWSVSDAVPPQERPP